MTNFGDLPYELRLTILEDLIKDVRNSSSTSTDRLSKFAAVCGEWQVVFERETFRQIIMSDTRLMEMDRKIKHRRGLVKHIHYYIQLPTYKCPLCQGIEPVERRLKNSHVTTWVLYGLFNSLGRWSSDEHSGLTLELSAFSPSDAQHWFTNHQFGPFFYSDQDDNDQNPRAKRLHPRAPGTDPPAWPQPRPQRSFPLDLNFRFTVHGSPLRVGLNFLRQVRVVTRLLFRRQCYRSFDISSIAMILQALPRLEYFHRESWRSLYEYQPVPPYQASLEILFKLQHIPILKELTLYEDYDGYYELLEDTTHPARPQVAAAIYRASAQLESLAVSFLIDARDFFSHCPPTREPALPSFPRLQSVSLTSCELSSGTSAESLHNLLHAAGNTALEMPNLQVMELWNGCRGEAAIFQYQRKPFNTVELTWLSSWNSPLNPKVVAHWREVALRHGCRDLSPSEGLIPAPPLCPGSMLEYLHLRHRILKPISLWQIQQEVAVVDNRLAPAGAA